MRKLIYGGAAMLLIMLLIAAKPSGITHLTSLWVGDATDTATVTPGVDDLFVSGTAEVDGIIYADGGVSDTTGGVTATEIANVVREIYLPMAGWAVDGGDDIDEGTAPDIGDDDNIPSITWDNSGEVVPIQQTFRLPTTYVDGLTLYCLISSDTALGTTTAMDWRIWVNGNTTFDAAAIEQTTVTATSIVLDASHEVLTLTLDATGEAALSTGCWLTVDLFNATTHASANLELKGTHGTYNSTM